MILLFSLLLPVIAILVFLRLPRFGASPSGQRLERIQRSPHYSKGQFQNPVPTRMLAEGVSYRTVFREFFFNRNQRRRPSVPLPAIKKDLVNASGNLLVWFGHSSYLLQVDGKRILVDPVFSGNASPVSFTTKSFEGTDVYTADDMPVIDYLVITHDHWDHLDYQTVLKLRPKIRRVITGLGTGAHFERWGFEKSLLTELDWEESIEPESGYRFTATPARHFSGRGLKRNGAAWLSLVLSTPSFRIFLGGDSGYSAHFKTIGDAYGPFDIALLENGQYDEKWKYIHMMPEQTVQAAQDLRAHCLVPVHWGKFTLANHAWDEPPRRVVAEARQQNLCILHPMIGDIVNLSPLDKNLPCWWEGVG